MAPAPPSKYPVLFRSACLLIGFREYQSFRSWWGFDFIDKVGILVIAVLYLIKSRLVTEAAFFFLFLLVFIFFEAALLCSPT